MGVHTVIRDERYAGRALDVTFKGELRPEQKVAAKAMLAHEIGVLAATTAFGKTVVSAWLIAQRGVSTLVLVHRRQLLDQWIERLATFLGMPAKSIGRIGGGRSRPNGMLDVAILQSLTRKGVVDDRVAEYPKPKAVFASTPSCRLPSMVSENWKSILLCADARIAVELDVGQHLADPVAYRRDRRKDQLLQENGYLVLRFLAEDVGKELDLVLDTILRALTHRGASATTVHSLTMVRRQT